MDIVTQGLMGATLAQACATRKETRIATLVGFAAPLLADADALIRSSEDPLLTLEYHRHFSHALVFAPIGALLAALLLWPFLRRRLPLSRIYLYALLGYATSGFLDACTSYGTHLLWPFSAQRTAWNIISIFDPIFSAALIAAIIIGIAKFKPAAARIGLLFAGVYFLTGALQHQRAEDLARETALQRGHVIERLVVKPSMGNLVLWRAVYEAGGMFYVDAIRAGLPGASRVYPGASAPVFDQRRDLPSLPVQSVLALDIQRFARFSDGFLVWHPERAKVLGDVRYAMLPTGTRPLWGIELDLEAPQRHASFNAYREMPARERQAFLAMLFGREPPSE